MILQLEGGNDGLNTVIPYADDEYYKARPGIAVARDSVLKLDDNLGLHPQLGGLKELYDEGMLAIVQGVGYPQQDRSHFRSMDIWQSASLDAAAPDRGWLGRALDLCTDRSDVRHSSAGDRPAAIAVGPDGCRGECPHDRRHRRLSTSHGVGRGKRYSPRLDAPFGRAE